MSVLDFLQSVSSTESSFDAHKMSRYLCANGSSGLSGILDDSDDDDDDDDDDDGGSPIGQGVCCFHTSIYKIYLLSFP